MGLPVTNVKRKTLSEQIREGFPYICYDFISRVR